KWSKHGRIEKACVPSGNSAAARRSCAGPVEPVTRALSVAVTRPAGSSASALTSCSIQGIRLASLRARAEPDRKAPLVSGPRRAGAITMHERPSTPHAGEGDSDRPAKRMADEIEAAEIEGRSRPPDLRHEIVEGRRPGCCRATMPRKVDPEDRPL